MTIRNNGNYKGLGFRVQGLASMLASSYTPIIPVWQGGGST